jgi:sec-independent protein translocase protein TatC
MTTPIEMPKIPLTGHLIELRKRLVHAAIAIAAGFALTYTYVDTLMRWFTAPLVAALPKGQQRLIFTGPAEAFMVQLKVALIAAVILVLPYLFWQLWLFIAPGLYKKEQQAALPVVAAACILFACGFAFAYFVVFPVCFGFFTGFATDYLSPMFSIKEYLAFGLRLLLMFGLVFELPLVSYILSRIGIINHRLLSKYRRHAIVAIFVVAAVFTPPDVFSQLMMAAPLLVLYEISIWVAYFFGKKVPAEETPETSQPA